MTHKKITSLNRPFLVLFFTGTALISIPERAHAATYQDYNSYGYINPASLSLIENFGVTGGVISAFYNNTFSGIHNGVSGKAQSTPVYVAPYGQIMLRLHPKWVIGFDVTDPLLSNINYTTGNAVGTKGILHSYDYSPKISFQLLDNVALGVGLDILQITQGELDFTYNGSLLRNTVEGISLGWNAGLLYKITPNITLSGSYYSQVNNNLTGTSRYRGASTSTSLNIISPQLFSLNYQQQLTSKWLVSVTARYILWNVVRNIVISNSPVGPMTSPQNFHDAWAGSGFVRYQFAKQWAALVGLAYEEDPQPAYTRSLVGAGSNAWSGGLGLQFMPHKNFQLQLIYGGIVIKSTINNSTTNGKLRNQIQGLDLSFTYKY